MASSLLARSTTLTRETNETKIALSLSIDGGSIAELPRPLETATTKTNGDIESLKHATQTSATQHISIDTGIGFLDHMLHALAKHAGWSLEVRARGDLHSKAVDHRKDHGRLLIYVTQSTITTLQKTPFSLLVRRTRLA